MRTILDRKFDLEISVIIRPDFRSQLKSGKYNLRLFVNIYRQQKKSYPVNIYVTRKEWDKLKSHSMFNTGNDKKETIIEIQAKANQIIRLLGDDFTFEEFERRMFGREVPKYDYTDVYATYAEKIAILRKESRISTAMMYQRSMESLMTIRQRLKFHHITVEFLKKYERHMLRKKCSFSTIGIQQRHLRAIVNIARFRGVVKEIDYPFGRSIHNKYQIPTAKTSKRPLEESELIEIINYQPTEDEAWGRDIWLFSFYCNGMNMVDIFNLKWGNIRNGFLYFIREKTKYTARHRTQIELFLVPQAMEIIGRWATPGRRKKDKFIFGVFDETMDAEVKADAARLAVRVVNESMRRIIRKLNINNRATTVVARHTWSTILMKNNVPVSYISKGLGHTSITTTEKYLGDFDQDQKREVGEIIANIGK